MFFATSILHVHLMQWDDDISVQRAMKQCDEVWKSIDPSRVSVTILSYFSFLCYRIWVRSFLLNLNVFFSWFS